VTDCRLSGATSIESTSRAAIVAMFKALAVAMAGQRSRQEETRSRRGLLGLVAATTVLAVPGLAQASRSSAQAPPRRRPPTGPRVIATPPMLRISDEQALKIGMRIWRNESGGRIAGLTQWTPGESFASCGIGHFIWFPVGSTVQFTESFPGLLGAIEASRGALPDWLRGYPACPWPTRDQFQDELNSPRMVELRQLMLETIAVQARYAANRLEAALPRMLQLVPASEAGRIAARFSRLAGSAQGIYALVDYVNFKGEGINPAERYHGNGWGLLQVLQRIDDAATGARPLAAFARAADEVLTRRVANSPLTRNEQRWLPGWRNRLRSYVA
jgi:hypothetical protein